MRAVMMIAVLAIAVPDRQDPTPKEAKPGVGQFSGEWQVVEALTSGRPLSSTKPGEAVFIIEGDRITIQSAATLRYTYSFTIDPTKNPATIDMKLTSTAGKQVKGPAAILGIAKIEGDTLTLCFKSGGPRPTEFTSTPGSLTILWQMKRKK